MLVGAVVWHEVDHDPQPKLMGTLEHPVEILECSKERVYIFVVTDVITGVFLGGAIKRREPNGINAEVFEGIQALCDAGQVSYAVTVGVQKTTWVNLVDNARAPPF